MIPVAMNRVCDLYRTWWGVGRRKGGWTRFQPPGMDIRFLPTQFDSTEKPVGATETKYNLRSLFENAHRPCTPCTYCINYDLRIEMETIGFFSAIEPTTPSRSGRYKEKNHPLYHCLTHDNALAGSPGRRIVQIITI